MATSNQAVIVYCSDVSNYISDINHQCNKRKNQKRGSRNPMKFLDLDNENEKEVVYHLYCRAVKKEYRSCDRITRNTSATISNYFKSDKFCFCANFTKIVTDQLNYEKYEQRKKTIS